MNKRGQFFLIAALVIIGIIAGLATIYSSASSQKEDATIYDLSNEIDFEASRLLDSGTFNLIPDEEIGKRIQNLTSYYAKSNPESDLLVIYGNETTLTFLQYNKTSTGNIGVSVGGSDVSFPTTTQTFSSETRSRDSDMVTITLSNGISYDFNLREGQFFFVVLRKDRQGERFVALPEGTN